MSAQLHDYEAEAACLGCVLADPGTWEHVSTLTTADFDSPAYGAVFSAMQAMDGKGVDVRTLATRLKAMGLLSKAGGEAALLALDQATPFTHHAPAYVKTVREMGLRRAALARARALAEEASNLAKPIAESLMGAASDLNKLASSGADSIMTGSDAMFRFMDKMDRIQRGEYSPVMPTGVRVLDYLFGGLQRGTMTILGARPGIGKTALAETIAINWAHAFQDAMETGKTCGRTGILWLEDPVEALERRLVAYTSTVPVWRIAKEVLRGPALDRVGDGIKAGLQLTGDAWRIKEASGLTAQQAVAIMRQMHAQHGVDRFIVDNLTEIELDDRSVRQSGESGATRDAVRLIRNAAKDLDVPVLLLIHLTRTGSKDRDQQNQRPTLESGFGSSAIEKMARLMIFLWDDPENKGYLAGFVPKQNEGAKMLEFWVRMNESAALVLNDGGKVATGTRGFTESAETDGVEFIPKQEAA